MQRHQVLGLSAPLSAPVRLRDALWTQCLVVLLLAVKQCRAAWSDELYPAGWATPESCVHGECLPWNDLPPEILDSLGMDDGGELFASGNAPNSRICARPDRIR